MFGPSRNQPVVPNPLSASSVMVTLLESPDLQMEVASAAAFREAGHRATLPPGAQSNDEHRRHWA